MLNVAEAVSGITEIKDILDSVLEMTLSTLNCERGSVHLFDQSAEAFTFLLSRGCKDNEVEKTWLFEQSRWLSPEAHQYQGFRRQILEGHATVINAEQYDNQPNLFNQTMVLAAPITHNHHILGLITLDRSLSHLKNVSPGETEQPSVPLDFSIWDMAVIEGIAQLAGLAIEQARWQQEAIEARTSEAAMREANALKDEFLAITAHEFRSPLTVILAQTQLVVRNLARLIPKEQEDNSEIVAKAVKNLSIVEDQTRQLTDIVQTFLEVSHLNRGKLTLSLTE